MTVMAQIQDHITQAKNPAILQEILEWRQAEYPRAQIHAFYPEFFGMVFVEKMNGDVRVSLFSNKRKKADFCFFADSLQKANHSINVWRTENERKLKRKQEAKVQSMLKKVQAPKACELNGGHWQVFFRYESFANAYKI